MSRFGLFRHSIAVSGSGGLSISSAPTILGDPVVGQRVYFVNGTYSAIPDSITPTVTVGGTAVDHDTDSLLVLDVFAGSPIGYSEIAHKSGYTDSSANSATSTANVANIDLTNAITAFSRTSSSGTTPMVWSITFGANVYAGYMTRWEVAASNSFSEATNLQDVYYQLTNDDLVSSANLHANLAAAGLTDPTATQYLRPTVFTTSPNGLGYLYTYPNPISPTDPAGHRYWKFNVTAGSYSVLREIIAATTVSGANVATGRTYTYTPSGCQQTGGSNPSSNYFDGNTATAGSFDTNAVALPNAVTIDFGGNMDLHELRLQQYSSNPSPPSAFTFAYSDNNSTFTNVVSASGLSWTADEIKTWSW